MQKVNIGKMLGQGVLLLAIFGAVWFGLSQIDFERIFNVKENAGKTEEKLGDMIWESIEKSEKVIHDDSLVRPLRKLVNQMCQENRIDSTYIKVHLIDKDEVNAFALPNGHLAVYTGLIKDCTSESELAGVLGHEIAHIEKDHVMKKLVKEFGLAVLVNMVSGGNGSIAAEIIQELSSSAYDRSLESEADMTSVDYLEETDLDPSKFADFMYRMSRESNLPHVAYYLSTHPESEERALAILDKIKGKKFVVKKILSDAEWRRLTEE